MSLPTPILAHRQGKTAEDTAKNKFLAFLVNGIEYALPIMCVREIVTNMEITPLPDSNACVRGVANLRGQTIPIVDLTERFGVSQKSNLIRRCIVIAEKPMSDGSVVHTGLWVDMVSRVVTLKATEINELKNRSAKQDYITGIVQDGHSTTVIIDLDKLLELHEAELLVN